MDRERSLVGFGPQDSKELDTILCPRPRACSYVRASRPEESVLERPSFQLVEGPGLQALSGRFGGTRGKAGFPGRRIAALPADSETCSGLQTQPCTCRAVTWDGVGATRAPHPVVRGAASEAGQPGLIPVSHPLAR